MICILISVELFCRVENENNLLKFVVYKLKNKGGDDRDNLDDQVDVPFGGAPVGNAPAGNASGKAALRGKLVKDQELVAHFVNVSAGRVELELCAEDGDALLYLSQTNTQPSEASNQLKLDTRVAADGRHCVRASALVNASCDPQTLHTSVLGAGRLNRFQLMLSQKAPEGEAYFAPEQKHTYSYCTCT